MCVVQREYSMFGGHKWKTVIPPVASNYGHSLTCYSLNFCEDSLTLMYLEDFTSCQ